MTRSRNGHRGWWRMLAGTLGAMLLVTAAYFAGRGVAVTRSLAADPTTDPIITAQVEQGPLREVVVGSATVEPGATVTVGPPALPPDRRPVVTALFVAPGDAIEAGDELVAVADRPVIALPGAIPAYRMLQPGLSGPDVAQLQEALAGLGFDIHVDGFYGAATARAVAALYEKKGFAPIDAAGIELDAANGAQAAIPLGEVVFIEALPGTVLNVAADRGIVGSQDLLTVASGSMLLVGTIPSVDVARIRVGHPAEVRFDDGTILHGEVAWLESGETPPASGATAGGSDMTSPPAHVEGSVRLSTPSPPSQGLLGRFGQLTIVVEQSPATSLSVPVTAVFASPAGRTWLVVLNESNRREVAVTIGLVAGGQAVVAPLDAELREGDEVLVAESGTLYQGTLGES